MSTDDHERFMRLAIEEARRGRDLGNIAVGVVIVHDGRVVARGRNEVTSTFDVTAHAEMVAIRQVSAELRLQNPNSRANSGPLAGATLYTTIEPCPMCCWAICIAGLSHLVFGAHLTDLNRGYKDYVAERLIVMTGQPLTVITGVLARECAVLRRGSE
jgi:tRNA(Arg) A34 adenosine deaminase TadA